MNYRMIYLLYMVSTTPLLAMHTTPWKSEELEKSIQKAEAIIKQSNIEKATAKLKALHYILELGPALNATTLYAEITAALSTYQKLTGITNPQDPIMSMATNDLQTLKAQRLEEIEKSTFKKIQKLESELDTLKQLLNKAEKLIKKSEELKNSIDQKRTRLREQQEEMITSVTIINEARIHTPELMSERIQQELQKLSLDKEAP